ncbi:mCG147327 [Mus musculus]|nr:mCG147327 [Mus musculus]
MVNYMLCLFYHCAILSWFCTWENPVFLKGLKTVSCFILFVCEYTVTVFRHTERGHQISLQMVVSYPVVAGN